MNITILIPTKNRFYFLNKILHYYDKIKFKGTILVVDSSDKNLFEKQAKLIKSFKNIIINHYYSSYNSCHATKEHLDKIKTKYVTWSGDDDYHIIKGLEQCILELEKKKLSSVRGGSYLFFLNSNNNDINDIRDYSGHEYLSNNKLERFQKFIDHPRCVFSNIWLSSVYKSALEALIDNSKIATECPDRYFYDEILFSATLVTMGKIGIIPETQFIMTMSLDRMEGKNWSKKINYNDQKKSINYMSRSIEKIINQKNKLDTINKSITNFIENKYNIQTLKKENIYKAKLIDILRKIKLLEIIRSAKNILIQNKYKLSDYRKSIIKKESKDVIDNIKNLY